MDVVRAGYRVMRAQPNREEQRVGGMELAVYLAKETTGSSEGVLVQFELSSSLE
jgi:hypothetical protein